jgi:hypothetical protein
MLEVSLPKIISSLVTLFLVALVGYCEAKGLLHAAATWRAGGLVIRETIFSFLFFNLSITTYILFVWSSHFLGIKSTYVHILIWILATTVTVAILSGEVFVWPVREKIVLLITLAGITWLATQAH